MACDFTFKHYSSCIESALKSGYRFYTHLDYWRTRPQGPSILLRHDVDNFVKRAVEFASIEAALGVPATYYVRIHGEYNIFHVNEHLRFREIRERGHELGLHTDVTEFAALTGQSDCQEDLFRRELLFLETALNVKVHGVTTHRDFNQAPNSIDYVGSLEMARFGLEYNGYDPVFVKERKYVSEKVNRGIGWWEECFCHYIGREEKLTILTHPRWWFHRHFYED